MKGKHGLAKQRLISELRVLHDNDFKATLGQAASKKEWKKFGDLIRKKWVSLGNNEADCNCLQGSAHCMSVWSALRHTVADCAGRYSWACDQCWNTELSLECDPATYLWYCGPCWSAWTQYEQEKPQQDDSSPRESAKVAKGAGTKWLERAEQILAAHGTMLCRTLNALLVNEGWTLSRGKMKAEFQENSMFLLLDGRSRVRLISPSSTPGIVDTSESSARSSKSCVQVVSLDQELQSSSAA